MRRVCPTPGLLGKLQTAERIDKTGVVRAGVGVSQSLIRLLQETRCQVDGVCACYVGDLNASCVSSLCVCVTRYYGDVFHSEQQNHVGITDTALKH